MQDFVQKCLGLRNQFFIFNFRFEECTLLSSSLQNVKFYRAISKITFPVSASSANCALS